MDGHRASRRCGCGSAAGGAARTAGRDDLRLWARTRTPPFRRLCHVEIRAQHRRTTCMSAPASPPPAGCLLEEGRSERPPPPPAAALPLPPPADGHRLRSAPSPGSGRRAARTPSAFPSAAPPGLAGWRGGRAGVRLRVGAKAACFLAAGPSPKASRCREFVAFRAALIR